MKDIDPEFFENVLKTNKESIQRSSEISQRAFQLYVDWIKACHEKKMITKVGEMKFVATNTAGLIVMHMVNTLNKTYGPDAGDKFGKEFLRNISAMIETDGGPSARLVASYDKIIREK